MPFAQGLAEFPDEPAYFAFACQKELTDAEILQTREILTDASQHKMHKIK